MLQLNHTHNSYKSIEEEIRKLEQEKEYDRHLSPSNQQEQQESKVSVNQLMKSRMRGKLRRNRTRTESFHFSSNDNSSPDESKESTLVKLRRKSATSDMLIHGFKMQVATDDKDDHEPKSSSSSSSTDLEKEVKIEPKAEPEEEVKEEVQVIPNNKPDVPVSIPSIGLIKRPKRGRVNSSDNDQLTFNSLSPLNSDKKVVQQEDEDYSGFGLSKGGGYKMSLATTDNKEEDKSPSNEDDYFGSFNKKKSNLGNKKRERRIFSAVVTEDKESKEIAAVNKKLPSKIKYSIHSIIEEEKSKSSSSASSVRSSDDLAFYFNNGSCSKRRRSSFWNDSLKSLTVSSAAPDSSSGSKSKKSIKRFKTKKYTEGDMSTLYPNTDKLKSKTKQKRRNSMSIVLAKFGSSD